MRCEKEESSKSSPSGRRGISGTARAGQRGEHILDPRLAPQKQGANLGHRPFARVLHAVFWKELWLTYFSHSRVIPRSKITGSKLCYLQAVSK
jgi:hypothetical protein